MKTKGEIIARAFSWIRISGLTSEPSQSEKESALEVLEAFANQFKSRNFKDYNFNDRPSLNDPSGISDEFFFAAYSNLAYRLAPEYGKTLTPEQKAQASQSLSQWTSAVSTVNPIKRPSRYPRGRSRRKIF